MKKAVILFFSIVSISYSQPIKVFLEKATALEEEFVHLVAFSKEAKEKIIHPHKKIGEMNLPGKYLNIFYSWDTKQDEKISVLVYQLKNEDLLYIDKNNDNDLSNDGEPLLFPLTEDSISFEIESLLDSKQKVKLALFRTPNADETKKRFYIDEAGNINQKFLPYAKIYSDESEFDGRKRSFYFDYRITLRKGKLKVQDSLYAVGLFDYSNNGAYNDETDLLIIDLTKTGNLNLDVASNVFSVHDVISLNGKNYKLSSLDKYGDYFVIEETKESPTFKYLERIQKEIAKSAKTGNLAEEFWNYQLVTVDGKAASLTEYKGKYLFANFWGEWCLPCINEITELKESYKKYGDQIGFISIMKIRDLQMAKKIISDKEIAWQNFFITDELEKIFQVKSYPSNVLINQDGKTFIMVGPINRTFFDMNIK
ncbi:MAG: alkyl hydroperoxide reductase/thiol specific antioxidant/mal allergen [Ignavibacteria bacterium]|nr:MAG: alkyl hydroperoxide reductase/thiol specific antioxidant/mal allergen [Ignavibacteria bacterium]KAF0155576.1 MAG: alkyl hydroperoxide reductase/thiol specific antioxidant/mal allergen [Ignavibacteria bacterium]